MWSAFLDPGFQLVSAPRAALRHFGQELTHFALHERARETVLWPDGEHGFNPYDFAELNLVRGLQPDDGADRVLVKRCMTAFNWELALDRHIEEQLEALPVSLVVLCPYDALFCHQELADWEQEDYLRHSLRHLPQVAARHQVSLAAMVDMDRLWMGYPTLARMVYEAAQTRWLVDRPDGRWRAVEEVTGRVIDPYLRRQGTLLDFVEDPIEQPAEVRPPVVSATQSEAR
ncbi:MAG: hypothetical protein ACPGQL_01020 [Thermoplasmatota archaeon]